jgi:hypothetical protein
MHMQLGVPDICFPYALCVACAYVPRPLVDMPIYQIDSTHIRWLRTVNELSYLNHISFSNPHTSCHVGALAVEPCSTSLTTTSPLFHDFVNFAPLIFD